MKKFGFSYLVIILWFFWSMHANAFLIQRQTQNHLFYLKTQQFGIQQFVLTPSNFHLLFYAVSEIFWNILQHIPFTTNYYGMCNKINSNCRWNIMFGAIWLFLVCFPNIFSFWNYSCFPANIPKIHISEIK